RRTDRVRLLSLAVDTIDGGKLVYILDCFALDPSPLWEALTGKELVIHNAAFDLGFLSRLGFVPGVVHDVMLLSRLLTAGTFASSALASCARRELGIVLDKAHKQDDWSGELAADQLGYAARDADVLVPLQQALVTKIKDASLERVAAIEARALPAFV